MQAALTYLEKFNFSVIPVKVEETLSQMGTLPEAASDCRRDPGLVVEVAGGERRRRDRADLRDLRCGHRQRRRPRVDRGIHPRHSHHADVPDATRRPAPLLPSSGEMPLQQCTGDPWVRLPGGWWVRGCAAEHKWHWRGYEWLTAWIWTPCPCRRCPSHI